MNHFLLILSHYLSFDDWAVKFWERIISFAFFFCQIVLALRFNLTFSILQFLLISWILLFWLYLVLRLAWVPNKLLSQAPEFRWLLQSLLKNSITILIKAFKERLEKQKIQKLIVWSVFFKLNYEKKIKIYINYIYIYNLLY